LKNAPELSLDFAMLNVGLNWNCRHLEHKEKLMMRHTAKALFCAASFAIAAGPLHAEGPGENMKGRHQEMEAKHDQMKQQMRQMEDSQRAEQRAMEDRHQSERKALRDKHMKEREALRQKMGPNK
jgi:Spy/CpxP family protein refolding chaperone